MGECPVCGDRVASNLELHVASHFEGPSGSRTAPAAQAALEEYSCPICEFPLTDANEADRQTHVNACLSGGRDRSVSPYGLDEYDDDQDKSEDETAYSALDRRKQRGTKSQSEWDGPAKPGAWQGWVGRRVEKGDEYWDPISAGEGSQAIPRNFSPGLIGVLARMLDASIRQGKTRSAALSRDTVHIRGVWGFDMGFGCGYRNALMAISALSIHHQTVHRIFSKETNGVDPGIRRIQGWIEEAWAAGYDIEGRDQLKGKLLGTRKWIGATDLYAMFTSKGVRCDLYDFKKPERGLGYRPAHKALQEWVKVYFGPDHSGKTQAADHQGDAFQTLMSASRDGSPRVTRSDRYPLILQHSGHSRTIVGYEETNKGEINLLLFDPGKRAVPSDLRAAGLAAAGPSQPSSGLNRSRTTSQPSMSRHRSSHEAMPFSRPYTNGASELVQLSDDDEGSSRPQGSQAQAVRIQGGGGGGGRPHLEEDEYEDKHGWIRKKIRKVTRGSGPTAKPADTPGGQSGPAGKEPWEDMGLSKALGYFRVNLASLGTHAQYQVLAFPGGPLLTPSQQAQRKTLSSTEVW